MIRSELTIALALVFAAITVSMHFRRPDVDPRTRGISRYATGRTKASMSLAFMSLSLSLANAAFDAQSLWLSTAALGMATVAAVPVADQREPKWQGPIHNAGAVLFFLAMPAAAFFEPTESLAATVVGRALIAVVTLFLLSMATSGLSRVRGALQRACFLIVVAWLVASQTSAFE